MEDITPELAADIIRDYVLPMFDSKEKRNLRDKYRNLEKEIGNNLPAGFQPPNKNIRASAASESRITSGAPASGQGFDILERISKVETISMINQRKQS